MNESTEGRGKAKQWDSIEREREGLCNDSVVVFIDI